MRYCTIHCWGAVVVPMEIMAVKLLPVWSRVVPKASMDVGLAALLTSSASLYKMA